MQNTQVYKSSVFSSWSGFPQFNLEKLEASTQVHKYRMCIWQKDACELCWISEDSAKDIQVQAMLDF
jgi:hypothetical protein